MRNLWIFFRFVPHLFILHIHCGQAEAAVSSQSAPGAVAVEIDQAARLDDFSLIFGHVLNIEIDLQSFSILDDISLDVGEISVHNAADTGHIDIIADLEGIGLTLEVEGDHAPVHDIGTISLGRVLLCDIGQAADPHTPIMLVNGADDLCAHCPNCVDGRCTSENPALFDRLVKEKLRACNQYPDIG